MFLIFTFSWLKPSWRLKIVMITGNKWLQYFCVDIGAINDSAPPFPLPFEVGVVGAMVDCLLVVGGQQHRQPWPLRLMSDCTHCTVANHQSKQHLLSLKTFHYFHYFNNLRYVNCFHFLNPSTVHYADCTIGAVWDMRVTESCKMFRLALFDLI